jgi:DNA-binding CsgD family transcriptional regulator
MPINQLSRREWEVVKLLLQGKSNKMIAASLHISRRTVEFHLKNIYTKLHVNSRIELILKLVNATGGIDIEKLGYSTVENAEKTFENRDVFDLSPSLFNERNKTMNTDQKKAFRYALTGFVPGVFLVMAFSVLFDGLRFFARNQEWKSFVDASILNQNFWTVFALELLLLTSGFVFAALIFGANKLNFTWRRSVIAGIGAVLILGIFSIFTQPMSLLLIIMASVFTGGFSALFMLNKTHRTMAG